MLKFLLATLLLTLPFTDLAESAQSAPAAAGASTTREVILNTSQGDITLELYPDKAPKSVANFMQYVHDGFYDGTVLHRVIPGYLVQGGLYTRELQPKRTRPAIASEADNGLSNLRGTIAVARGADPDSGSAQFFINLVDNRRLDFVGNQSSLTWGFAVFGKVLKGMDVLDKIAALPTRALGPFAGDVPDPIVVITHAGVVGENPPAAAVITPPDAPAPASKAGKKKPKHPAKSATAADAT